MADTTTEGTSTKHDASAHAEVFRRFASNVSRLANRESPIRQGARFEVASKRRSSQLGLSTSPSVNSRQIRDFAKRRRSSSEFIGVNPSRRYLLISPCRDEAQHLRRTLDSVAAQSVQPALWVIVDDGSTDETPRILEDYARRLPYLRVVQRADRGRREVGPGVVAAFYAGLNTVRLGDFDYLCKLDMDLDLPVRYFELLMRRMESDPRIGTTSGKPWFVNPRSGALEPEVCGDEMSVGMTKFYRVACFQEIGGFVRQVMWDGIDCHRARMLGWIAESIDDEPLRFVHLRPQGASQKGIWTGRLRAGFGQYFMGTSPLYYLAAAIYRLPAHPAVIGSAAMLWGYFRSWLKGLPRYDDPEFRGFLRSYQHACLRMGKRAATARVNAERAPLWRASPLRRESGARDDGAADSARSHRVERRPQYG
jgi:poly-beta-1,6-N-acetyl-D-glucosamine synthase